jgi:SNF2 family DNA or RNA helicase
MLHMINRRVWNSQYAYCVEFCAGRMVFKPWLGKEAFDCSGRSNVKELHERITPIMLRRLKTEVLDLPEKSRETIECGLSREYQKIYDEAAAKFLEWLFQKFGGGKAGEEAVGRAARAEAITRMNALRLICAKGKVETAVHYVKLSLEADKPLIVAYIHNEVLDLIDKEMKKLERDRLAQEKRGEIPDIAKPIRWDVFRGGLTPTQKQQMADRFQNGDIDVLFYNIALGTGTTLTRATEMLFLERSWVPGTNVQMEDRIHRISQKNAVTIQYLSAIGTIDEHIAALLVDKVKTSLGVIDGIECDENEAGDIVFGTMLEDIMARGRGMRKNPEDGLRVSWNQAMSYEEPEPDEPELPVDELPVDEDTGGDEEVAAFEVGQTYAVGDEEP